MSKTEKRRKIIALLMLISVLCVFVLVFIYIGRPLIEFLDRPQEFREWINSFGIWGRLIFIGIIFLQVIVAVIPGEPFEIAAGYTFGSIEGTLLCVFGMTLSGILIFVLVRKYGVKFVELFFSTEKINSLKFLNDSKKLNVLFFILMLIPGTPKDLLCYFAGLTRIKLSHFIFISAVARIPSVVTSSIGGSMLGQQKYVTAIIAFGVTILISLIGLLIYKMIEKRKNS